LTVKIERAPKYIRIMIPKKVEMMGDDGHDCLLSDSGIHTNCNYLVPHSTELVSYLRGGAKTASAFTM
jgi:hypothetical protein